MNAFLPPPPRRNMDGPQQQQQLQRQFCFNNLILVVLIGILFALSTTMLYSFVEDGDLDEENDYFFERVHNNNNDAADATPSKSFFKGGTSKMRKMKEMNMKQKKHARKLFQIYEQDYPPNHLMARTKPFVYEKLRRQPNHQQQSQNNMPYDIYNCPPTPPPNYPMEWNTLHVLQAWNPANVTIPTRIHQGLCVFDFETDMEQALAYREAEVPFIIQNQPDVLQTAERWNRNETYLLSLLKDEQHRVEHSQDVHFMYWKPKNGHEPRGWKPPTDPNDKLSYKKWLQKAKQVQQVYDASDGQEDLRQMERYYFRLNGDWEHQHSYLYQELPLFDFHKHNNFFMVSPQDERGINCRFGMAGTIAEAHYDQSRNFILVLGGQRRYILSHPRSCPNMCLYPRYHPSGRHSRVDWTEPKKAARDCPDFAHGTVNEVVLEPGDTMYLPTNWLHFIVSLNINYQCNARSGTTWEYQSLVEQCGF